MFRNLELDQLQLILDFDVCIPDLTCVVLRVLF